MGSDVFAMLVTLFMIVIVLIALSEYRVGRQQRLPLFITNRRNFGAGLTGLAVVVAVLSAAAMAGITALVLSICVPLLLVELGIVGFLVYESTFIVPWQVPVQEEVAQQDGHH